MTDTAVPASFRDPAGFVFRRDGVLLRQVNERYREHYDLLRSSGLYDALVGERLLVPHDELDPAEAAAPGAYRVLRPQVVPFVSHPYEWCPGQLRAAALATLRVQSLALDHGMSLRDASAYNVQFAGPRPVLIDTLSFERLVEGRPWVAYRQFCQHFLAPLALMVEVDVRLGQLLRVHLDGVPLDLAGRLLPASTRLRPALALHLHQHARSQRRHAGASDSRDRTEGRFSLRAFRGLVDSLRGGVERLRWEPDPSAWRDYAAGDSYSQEALAHKTALVAAFLDEARPRTVWDLGANTGRYSRLAAERGAFAVAFDGDVASVEAAQRALEADAETGLLPLVLDLANPSPAQGWAHAERASLAERGPADLVLALALVHHLAIGNNVPLPRVADFLAELAPWLAVEWVPKDDPKVVTLLASREDVFEAYSEESFRSAFERRYRIQRREPVRDSGRVLYLLRSR